MLLILINLKKKSTFLKICIAACFRFSGSLSFKKNLMLVELLGALERTCSLLHARVIRHVCNRLSRKFTLASRASHKARRLALFICRDNYCGRFIKSGNELACVWLHSRWRLATKLHIANLQRETRVEAMATDLTSVLYTV